MRVEPGLSRRLFLVQAASALTSISAGLACSPADPKTPLTYAFPHPHSASGNTLAPTPDCGAPAPLTVPQIEGPFYTPGTPERRVLVASGPLRSRLRLAGRVLTTDCRPIPGAVLDFWQADPAGEYDNRGFSLRGHQFTDESGAFQLETVMPGAYRSAGIVRTPHIHVKAQGLGTDLLTTQLYFPSERERNAADYFFRPELLLEAQGADAGGILEFAFDFVLAERRAA
jgi:protocatechuate 3,4-dioxygenase beta subunit